MNGATNTLTIGPMNVVSGWLMSHRAAPTDRAPASVPTTMGGSR